MERIAPVSGGALAEVEWRDGRYLHLVNGGIVSGSTTFTDTLDVGESDNKKWRFHGQTGPQWADWVGMAHYAVPNYETDYCLAQRKNGDTIVNSSGDLTLQATNRIIIRTPLQNYPNPPLVTITADGLSQIKPMRMANLTTTERDALTVTNGAILYNSSTNKLQGYANGTWVDLH